MAISASQQFKHFNSIKVRLELGWCGVEKLLVDDFNSIKVRLELPSLTNISVSNINFNSIKVRLERPNGRSKTIAQKFQFHKGTIRTFFFGIVSFCAYKFQFHKGTIRTCFSANSLLLVLIISIP